MRSRSAPADEGAADLLTIVSSAQTSGGRRRAGYPFVFGPGATIRFTRVFGWTARDDLLEGASVTSNVTRPSPTSYSRYVAGSLDLGDGLAAEGAAIGAATRP
jgi:hypothetical protein